LQALLEDALFALELAELEADSSSLGTAAAGDSELASLLGQARTSLQQLSTQLDKWELRMLLSGPYDEAGALLTITAGAGDEPFGICIVLDS
jgi:peptide chain release factor 2